LSALRKIARWENDTRWYETEFACDLIGDLVVIRCWGEHDSKQHGMKNKENAVLVI
jgi:hypothetical protein